MVSGGISGILELGMCVFMTYLFIKTDYKAVNIKEIVDKKIIYQNKATGKM